MVWVWFYMCGYRLCFTVVWLVWCGVECTEERAKVVWICCYVCMLLAQVTQGCNRCNGRMLD